jgi:hypothetical protein
LHRSGMMLALGVGELMLQQILVQGTDHSDATKTGRTQALQKQMNST